MRIFFFSTISLCLFASLALLFEEQWQSLFHAGAKHHIGSTYSSAEDQGTAQSFFGAYSTGSVLTVSNVDEGLHEVEDDYLSFIWFSLAEMPSFGERILLLSRNRIDNGRRTSFSISLQGTVGGVRPLISLGNPTRAGEWIPFAEASLQVERWYALVISHVEAGFLTVRMISKGNDSPPVLLGAHRVVEGAEKEHKATLSVGSIGSQGFRGRIGSFGMVRGNSLEDHMQDYIEAISDPSEGPPKALLRTVMLWATPYNDLSSYHREVRIEEEMRSVKKTIKNRDRKSTEKRVKKRLNSVKKGLSSKKLNKKTIEKDERVDIHDSSRRNRDK